MECGQLKISLLKKIINSKSVLKEDFEVNKIKTDSRCINKGDIFLAINSGYLYANEAIKNGAIAVISEHNLKVPLLKVSNALLALKNIASYMRSQYHNNVIAITGSNGKTTTKEMFKHILSKKYRVLTNPDSKNNIIGISNTLLDLDNNYDFLVLELGMNHRGEIRELSNLVKPDIGIITNIGSAHIGNLGSLENIFKAKIEILTGNPKMELYVNGSDDYLKMVECHKVYALNQYEIIPNLVKEVCLNFKYQENELKELINSFKGIASRMEELIIGNHIVIDDAYNASYESFIYGLAKIKEYDCRKIVVFGDILELGSYSDYYHLKIYEEIKKLEDVVIFTLGDLTAKLDNKYHFNKLEELKEYLKSYTWLDNDLIYLKGSHKNNLSSLCNFFKCLWEP